MVFSGRFEPLKNFRTFSFCLIRAKWSAQIWYIGMKSQNKSKSQFLFGPAAAWWRFVHPTRVLFPTNQPTNQPPPLFQWTKYWRGKKKKKNGGGANSPTTPFPPHTPRKNLLSHPLLCRSTVSFWVTLSLSGGGRRTMGAHYWSNL